MKAMILAAGLGTRLRPLTDDRPKALVEVGGRTLLEICLERLRGFGVSEVIVNTHHFAEMVEVYLKAHGNFGMRIEISREDALLDTGGGVKRAAWFFLEGGGDEPFLVHNVDVMSSIDLGAMVRFHRERGALATLAVQERKSSRYLVFDEDGVLCGRETGLVRECGDTTQLAFAGIHVLSPRIFSEMTEVGAFSIIDAYLRLAGSGERAVAFRADESDWRDLGRPESVAAAEREMGR
jgi:NDP-sugar pyrophosphorylase family protein